VRRAISSVAFSLILVCFLTLIFEVEPVRSNNSSYLLLETDKEIYQLRETITIRLINTSNQTKQWCGYLYPFNIYTYPEEKLVFRTWPVECCFTLGPWAWTPWDWTHAWNILHYRWNQSDQFTVKQVELGEYVVRDNQGWGLSAHFKIIGADINGDNVVDIYDVILATDAYWSRPSDPHWNPHCDIAEAYGIIDIFDIVTICISYGEEYTP